MFFRLLSIDVPNEKIVAESYDGTTFGKHIKPKIIL